MLHEICKNGISAIFAHFLSERKEPKWAKWAKRFRPLRANKINDLELSGRSGRSGRKDFAHLNFLINQLHDQMRCAKAPLFSKWAKWAKRFRPLRANKINDLELSGRSGRKDFAHLNSLINQRLKWAKKIRMYIHTACGLPPPPNVLRFYEIRENCKNCKRGANMASAYFEQLTNARSPNWLFSKRTSTAARLRARNKDGYEFGKRRREVDNRIADRELRLSLREVWQ